MLSFGNDLLTNDTDNDDISSATSELTVAEVRLTKSLALHISITDLAPQANKMTSIKLDIRRFKVSVARSKRFFRGGSNSDDPPQPAVPNLEKPPDFNSSLSSPRRHLYHCTPINQCRFIFTNHF